MAGEPTTNNDGGTVLAIAQVAVSLVPEILALLRSRHAAVDPDAPTATDAEVLAGLSRAVASSIERDDLWLAAHPADA